MAATNRIEWTSAELKAMEQDFQSWKENGGSGKDWATRCFHRVYQGRGGRDKVSRAMKETLWKKLARSDNPDLSEDASIPVGMLQKALSKYIRENYSQEALDDAQDLALEWNQLGPPPEVQAKMAETRPGMELRRMTEHLFRQYNMAIIAFTVHKDKDGKIAPCVILTVHSHDWNHYGVGHSFEEMYPEWETSGKRFSDIVVDFGIKVLQGEGTRDKKAKGKNREITIPYNTLNCPILPPEDPLKPWTHDEMKTIIRLFLIEYYSIAVGTKDVSPPWGALDEKREDFIKSEFFPQNFVLGTPWKIEKEKARQLLDFWYARQDNPDVTDIIRFHAYKRGRGAKADIVPSTSKSGPPIAATKRTGRRKSRGRPASRASQPHPTHRPKNQQTKPQKSKDVDMSSGEEFGHDEDSSPAKSKKPARGRSQTVKQRAAAKTPSKSKNRKTALSDKGKSPGPSLRKEVRFPDDKPEEGSEDDGDQAQMVRCADVDADTEHCQLDSQEHEDSYARPRRETRPTKFSDGTTFAPLSRQKPLGSTTTAEPGPSNSKKRKFDENAPENAETTKTSKDARQKGKPKKK
ncbi:hypothetical protein BDN72DRAFT_865281 [Pluteus cervinus]|uniref:Uncharacterized protein n=1 Tax=Pluteus cervinus TaxID=181527 RepID=A0ACD3A0B1_9AGAR|nr:hypothetical protein BDN72DRAFT_865281 [Pluteus cervinus]